MIALLFTLLAPIVPIVLLPSITKLYVRKYSMLIQYFIYLIVIVTCTTFLFVLVSDEGISFLEKLDRSPSFSFKYVIIQYGLAFLITFVEWTHITKRFHICVDVENWKRTWFVRFVHGFIFKYGIYILAALIICLNCILAFDNVVWGDEAFSANTVQNNITGILQIMYYWDSHPPLYYFWLHLCTEILGYNAVVYHFASLAPFIGCVILLITVFRKKFGTLPSVFALIIIGLASPCVNYNLEIRMYSLAFFEVFLTFYFAYAFLCGSKKAWIFMTIFAIAGAYTHYFVLVTCGILIFITGVAATIRFRKEKSRRTGIKALASMVLFCIGYLPWMKYFLHQTEAVSGSWWMSEPALISDIVKMLMGGEGMFKYTFPIFLIVVIVPIVLESGIFSWKKEVKQMCENEEYEYTLGVATPSLTGWSDTSYGVAVGFLTIFGTIVFGYIISAVMSPILNVRYVYPMIALTILCIIIGMSWCLKKIDTNKTHFGPMLAISIKSVLGIIMILMLVSGIGDYKAYKATADQEKAATEDFLSLIGEIEDDTVLISYGVKHFAWTVLDYYYPGIEIIAGDCVSSDASDIWYFDNNMLSESNIDVLTKAGYTIEYHGMRQLGKYPCQVYHYYK